MAQKRDENISSKKVGKQLLEEEELPEITLAHPKAKKWIVAMATANYQELAKLANHWPELVKLRDPFTGYSALHWAAKHGNEDMVNLIAGTYKADVNCRTNGGYTPLHIAMYFDRSNVFHMLSTDYKANIDLLDWTGNKALNYSKQKTSVSASPYSNECCPRFVLDELNSDYHFKLPSNIRNLATNIKRSLEGGTLGRTSMRFKKRYQLNANSPLTRTQSLRTGFPSNSMLSLAGNEENLQPCWLPIPNISPARDDLLSKDAHTEGTRVESVTPRSKKNFLSKTIRAATALF